MKTRHTKAYVNGRVIKSTGYTKPTVRSQLSERAKAAWGELETIAVPGEPLTLFGSLKAEPHHVTLPAEAVAILKLALENFALGRTVAMVSVDEWLTTTQAADILGVSRPFIIKQIDEGRLACQMCGSHRRIKYDDLIVYDDRRCGT